VRSEGAGDPRTREGVPANLALVSPEYFRALGVPLLAGRAFTDADGAGAPAVAIVSASLARQLAPRGDAVGRRFFAGSANDPVEWTTVVGVVPDFVLNAAQADTRLMFFRPWAQDSWWSADRWLVVRRAAGVEYPGGSVRRLVAALGPDVPLSEVQSLESFIDRSLAGPRSTGTILGVFAVAGLLVSLLGLHGVIAYAMSQRTRELGIRMALGANRERLLGWVLSGALRTIVTGLALGAVGTVLALRLLPDLVRVEPVRDLPSLLAVAALVAATGVAAAFAPAWRATRIEPAVALRHD
jgi:putative ABC transport system permease protein